VDDWRKEYVRAMTVHVYYAHVAGDAEAYRAIQEPADWMVINSAAKEYSTWYGQTLEEEGGSYIKGQFIPWLDNLEADGRSEVARIIDEGLREGLPTGVRESGKGTYPKGSIAAQLQDYFDERKSHAATVARTEIGRIQNVSKLDRWDERGWEVVQVQDGDGANPCEECTAQNGEVWTLEYAQGNELEHPNCVRNFFPLRPGQYDPSEVVGF